MDNSSDVEKNDQYGLDIAANLTRFIWPWWIWRLPPWRLLLSLMIIIIHPCFITGYDIRDKVGVISGLLFEFPADRNAMGLLVVAHQSWQKFHRYASCISSSNCLPKCTEQSLMTNYYLTNIGDSSTTICNNSLANFCHVFQCCACQQSSRTLIVVNRCSSVLEVFVPSQSFALAHRIISEGFLQHSVCFCSTFFKTETKFDADSSLLKLHHISCKKITISLKHNITKTHWT
jgi:hypothetical protein